jgi:hypothetical protein
MAMKRKYHWVGFTAAQSAELWERWKKGEGLKSIGRAFGKPSSCIFAPFGVAISCSKFVTHVADALIASGEIALRASENKARPAAGPTALAKPRTFTATDEPAGGISIRVGVIHNRQCFLQHLDDDRHILRGFRVVAH